MAARVAPTVPTTPTTSTAPVLTHCDTARNALAQICKISKNQHRGRGTPLVKNAEVQALIDSDVFCIQTDRRSKLNALQQYQLIKVLAQFFLERNEDAARFSYFEAIFFGREGEVFLHEFRIDMMFRLASFALQYPILQIFNHIMMWMYSKQGHEFLAYADQFTDIINEHFLRSSTPQNNMESFMNPLEYSCPEFTAIFVLRAPLNTTNIYPNMCRLLVRYLNRNMQFILRHLREYPFMADEFSLKTLPVLVGYCLSPDGASESAANLTTALCYIISRWHTDVLLDDRKPLDLLDMLLMSNSEWSKRRIAIVVAAISASKRPLPHIVETLETLCVPLQFQPVIDALKSKVDHFNRIAIYEGILRLDNKEREEERKQIESEAQ